jgi:hypothetical protein
MVFLLLSLSTINVNEGFTIVGNSLQDNKSSENHRLDNNQIASMLIDKGAKFNPDNDGKLHPVEQARRCLKLTSISLSPSQD